MKQANLSTLLSNCSSWETLTLINRNRFITIFLWLQDPKRIEKVNFIKSKLSQGKYLIFSLKFYFKKGSIIHFLDRNNDTFSDKKRQRVVLTKHQLDRLKALFNINPYPCSDDIDLLSIELGLNKKKITAWFTHQRTLNKPIKINFI
jgi:hypothetical protein